VSQLVKQDIRYELQLNYLVSYLIYLGQKAEPSY